jgi:hypothetical protein
MLNNPVLLAYSHHGVKLLLLLYYSFKENIVTMLMVLAYLIVLFWPI